MDISFPPKRIVWRSAVIVALLTILHGVVLSDEEVCLASESNCTCSSPPPRLPPRPSFCCERCSVGVLPANLTSVNGTCETNATIPCYTACMFECEVGYTITHNDPIVCNEGILSPVIPSCNETDECLSSPCQNNGTCIDLFNDYYCTCVPGYEGENCEDETDECLTNPCENNGTCRDLFNDYDCTCLPAYEGKNCENVSTTTAPQTTTIKMMTSEQETTPTSQNSAPAITTSETATTQETTTPSMVSSTISDEPSNTTDAAPVSIPPTDGDTTPRATTSQREPASTSSTATSSPTETILKCTLPTVEAYTDCPDNVQLGTSCNFNCSGNKDVHNHTCISEETWEPTLPDCGNLGLVSKTNMTTMKRKRRDTLPVDNPAVLTVQETYESAIIDIATTYLVNVTATSAQNLTDGTIEMNFLINVMYTSHISVDDLITEIEEAIFAVDEFEVVSASVLDLDAICSSTPCNNNGECQVDYYNFDFTCNCVNGYTGPLCETSPDYHDYILLAILVPISVLIFLFIIFFIVLVVCYRVRLHKSDGYTKRPFHYKRDALQYDNDTQQLYLTEDKNLHSHDRETFMKSATGLRFSKEINARMRERSREIELQEHSSSTNHHDPTNRPRSQTDPVHKVRSFPNGPVTRNPGFQRHPNGIRSGDNRLMRQETGNTSTTVYSMEGNSNRNLKNSSHGNYGNRSNRSNQAASNSANVVYNRGRSRQSIDDRNMVPLNRSRGSSVPADVHISNGFVDTRL